MIRGLLAILIVVFTINTSFAIPPKANLVPSDYDTGIKYEDAIKQNKPMVVKFYVDWCGYCKRFAPVFDNIRRDYQGKFSFVLVNCDDARYTRILEDFAIISYPTVFIVDPTNDNRVMVNPVLYGNKELVEKELERFLKVNSR